MRRATNRLTAWGVPVALAATTLLVAAGSSSVSPIVEPSRDARWFALGLLAVLAAAGALRERPLDDLRRSRRVLSLAVVFLALAGLSAAWSLDAWLTLKRAGSLVLLFAAAASIALLARRDRELLDRVLVAVVVAAAVVAGLGALVIVVDYDSAVQGVTATSGWRYRGFGANPNTAPMLLALALPLALRFTITVRSSAARFAAGLALVGFTVSIVASQSRGALAASVVGTATVALALVPGAVRKAAVVAAILAVFGGGTILRETQSPSLETPEPIPAAPKVEEQVPPAAPGTPQSTSDRPFPKLRGPFAVRPEDEIGHPLLGPSTSSVGSGRFAAWEGALETALKRPVLGHGFGVESLAFVDRWYFFQGANPENAFLGLLLQLGVVGLTVLSVLVAILVVRGARELLRLPPADRGALAATYGILLAGIVLMTSQSYVYAVGNIATVTFWTAAFVVGALAAPSRHTAEVALPTTSTGAIARAR